MFFNRRDKGKPKPESQLPQKSGEQLPQKSGESETHVLIKLENLSPDQFRNMKGLTEIKDREIISRLDSVIPGFMQLGATAAVSNAASSTAAARDAVEQLGSVYRAIIPDGMTLSKSASMPGAFRAFAQNDNGHISAQANLVEVKPVTRQAENALAAAKRASAAVTVNAVMNVASMVVGQYYMSQVSDNLIKINKSLQEIASFQQNEYKSKILALVNQLERASHIQPASLENEEYRRDMLRRLDNWEDNCVQLLGQANLTIADFTHENHLKYEDYEKMLPEIDNWLAFQQILLQVLYRIVDLRYALYMGKTSRQDCMNVLPKYKKQSEDTLKRLTDWHKANIHHFNIDLKESKRERKGWDRAVHTIPALVNDELQYRHIPGETSSLIKRQLSASLPEQRNAGRELYNEEVQLISKDGKLYYLPSPASHGHPAQ